MQFPEAGKNLDEKISLCEGLFRVQESEKVSKIQFFPEMPTARKCCKKQYEINIFVVRDPKTTWEIMKMKIMYEQKTWENLMKTNDFWKSPTRESEKV